MILQIALITAAFVIVAYVGILLTDVLVLRNRRVQRRVTGLAGDVSVQATEPLGSSVIEADRLPTLANLMSNRGLADKILLKLMRAGVKLRPSEFIGIACGLALVLGLVLVVLTKNIGAEILGVAVGFACPFLYLSMLQARRTAAFSVLLPDALMLMASAIRSGYGVQRAMATVADEMPEPISEEFRRVLNEINVGWTVELSLMRMAERIMSYDVELVVTAIIVQQEVGGNLAEIIENIAGTIRDRVRVEGEIAAMTAEGKISGLVLVALPLIMAAVIYVLNPRYLKPLVTEPVGIWLIVIGVALQIVGGLIIKRMLVVDY